MISETLKAYSRAACDKGWRRLRLFPERGDVVQLNMPLRFMIRDPYSDPKEGWLQEGSRWFIVSCQWHVINHEKSRLPVTEGCMIISSYGSRNTGLLEAAWSPDHPGTRGFMQRTFGGFFSLYDGGGRLMTRLLGADDLKLGHPVL
jgi:hypothetical protein